MYSKRGQKSDPPDNGDARRILYCLVPDDKPNLRELLDRHYRQFDEIRVVAERRGLDRRTDADRRRGAGEPRGSRERRRVNPEPERRAQRRRAQGRPVKPPVPLPPEADRYVDQIVFVERVEGRRGG
jgi:hypothetical protein